MTATRPPNAGVIASGQPEPDGLAVPGFQVDQETSMKTNLEPLNGTLIEFKNEILSIIQVNSEGESSEVLIPQRYLEMFLHEIQRVVG